MLKIIHIISGLKNGGAEKTLYKICKYDKINKHIVISLGENKDKYFLRLSKLKVEIYSKKLSFFSFFYDFFSLSKFLKSFKPNIVQTWLPYADLIGGVAARIAGIKNIVWNIRYSKLDDTKLKIYFGIKLLSKLSHIIPRSIISNSKKSIIEHINLGYDRKKFFYIPNGYNTFDLQSDQKKKKFFKKKKNLKNSIPIIGHIGRYNEMKDHHTLFGSLNILKSKKIKFICVLVGPKINHKNKELKNHIKINKLERFIKLLDEVDDISLVMNGIDICVLSSKDSEGFPNVLCEAMLCETPCITTNIGDAPEIVGKTGWIVERKNPLGLACAIQEAVIEMKTSGLNNRGKICRARIKKKYNIENMMKLNNNLWNKFEKLR